MNNDHVAATEQPRLLSQNTNRPIPVHACLDSQQHGVAVRYVPL